CRIVRKKSSKGAHGGPPVILRRECDPRLGNFSTDGRWIVYAARCQDASSKNPELYTLAVDANSEFHLGAANTGGTRRFYAPDENRIVFVAERSGRRNLWTMRVANGKPAGAPEVLKTDPAPMGFTAKGSLYFYEDAFRTGVFAAELDPATWKTKIEPKE